MLFGPKSRIHHGKLPERVTDVKLSKTLTITDSVTQSGRRETGRRRQTWLSREDRLLALHAGTDRDGAALPHRVPKYLNIKDPLLPPK